MAETLSNNGIVQQIIEQQIENGIENENLDLDFNPLQLYFGDDYIVNEKIRIRQPSIQDFIDYGDNNIFNVIMPFVSNTTSCRVQLWDKGIDWNKITNQELFSILIKNIDARYSKIIFGDIDFSTFQLRVNEYEKDVSLSLYSPELDIEIDESTRQRMCRYIQYMFNIYPPEEEFCSNKMLKQELINNDKQKQLKALKEKGKDNSFLAIIASYLNHPGCSYTKNELKNVKYFEFIYNTQRMQIYESTRALLNGRFSGMCDLSKVDKNEFNFMRDIKINA